MTPVLLSDWCRCWPELEEGAAVWVWVTLGALASHTLPAHWLAENTRATSEGSTVSPSCTVLYYTVLYCTVLYCTVLYCTVLYCTVPEGGVGGHGGVLAEVLQLKPHPAARHRHCLAPGEGK